MFDYAGRVSVLSRIPLLPICAVFFPAVLPTLCTNHWLWTESPNLQRKCWNAPKWPGEKERREAESSEKEREKNLALNEVLREVHNAVCTALKDFSSVGVFLYGPQQTHVQGWVGGGFWGGGGAWLWGLPCWDNCANNSSSAGCTPYQTEHLKTVSRCSLSLDYLSGSPKVFVAAVILSEQHKSCLWGVNHCQPRKETPSPEFE